MTEQAAAQWLRYQLIFRRLWARRPTNPSALLRPVDRIESIVLMVAASSALLAVPVAGTVGTVVYANGATAVAGICTGLGIVGVGWLSAWCLVFGSTRLAARRRDRYWDRRWRSFVRAAENSPHGDTQEGSP
ncbi:hypothetical protein [Nocardia grenadensis]|uniref:hypothetical protein n=1 Tax=Nocardia grenadensis TaxID=931537 RepID=UPI0007A42146|nr:hypothetical protein [Nocardia grenadensis]